MKPKKTEGAKVLYLVIVVKQSVLLVYLEVLQGEGDEPLPEVMLDGEHAVLGPAGEDNGS